MRKKNNNRKRFERVAKSLRFVHKKSFGLSEDGEHILEVNLVRPVPALKQHYTTTAVQLMDSQRLWCVEVFVECIDDQGNRYTESADMVTTERCKLNDLTPTYLKLKDELFNAVNPKHYSDSGWIARVV